MFIKLDPAGHAEAMSQLRAEGAGITAAAETLGTATTQTGAEWTGDAATASAALSPADAPDSVENPVRRLVSLTNDVPPLAAVSLGNVDLADNITYTIPGIRTDTNGSGMQDWVDVGNALYVAQLNVAEDKNLAVVAWIGYKTPNDFTGMSTWSMVEARAGGENLNRALLGTSASNPGASLNVAALSYGGTTAAEALSRGTAHVDSLVLAAVPGIANDLVKSSMLHADVVYSGENDDTWKWGRAPSWEHNSTPTDKSFGAVRLGTDGESDLAAVNDHSALGNADEHKFGYFSPGTEALMNIALATTGQQDKVTGDSDY